MPRKAISALFMLSALALTTGGDGLKAADAPVNLTPHRAVYRLSLAGTRQGSQVAGVVGGMEFVWKDACQGWTTEQKFRVRFLYGQGDDQEMSTSYVTWESKDGRTYRFNVRKTAPNQDDQELRGEAQLDGDAGGVVRFQKPQHPDIPLQPGTMFPTAHTAMLISNALHGGGALQVRPVFDGSEVEGASPVSAIIGRGQPLAGNAIADAALRRPQSFPVHLAFFARDVQQATPDYDTMMLLLDNGVIQSMLIDYGDFTVRAELQTLQALPRPQC